MLDLARIQGLRSLAWRLGRRSYLWARREGPNDPNVNGEFWLLEKVVDSSAQVPLVLLDVGANRGDYSARASEILRSRGRAGVIYALEPAQSTFESLAERFEDDNAVKPHRLAVSSQTGEAQFHVVGPMAGTNSLHPPAGNAALTSGRKVELVTTQSLDEFLESQGIDVILIVKVDTEGHDYSVILGAKEALTQGRIDVLQFEYNHRWIANRATLKDVFDLIATTPYDIGKLYGNGVELYDRWHPELDRYFETNCVLVRKGCAVESLARRVNFNAANVVTITQSA